MRILLIHAEKFWFKARQKAIKSAESLEEVPGESSAENALVAFVSVEARDEANIDDAAVKAADAIEDVFKRVKAESIVVYPYAHLSSELAAPSKALEALKKIASELERRGYKVIRAPFGWYKAFEIKCYGHPLAELSREVKPVAAAKLVIERKYYILTPSGELYKPEEYVFKEGEEEFKALVEKEALKKELPGGEKPRVVDYCRKFGFEWEPLSDIGHMRYGPHATVMVESVADYAWKVAQEVGVPVFKVMGTNTFDLNHPAVRKHAELFGERLYEIRVEGGRYILRYAACFQQFSILSDWQLSYRNLPMGMLEIADSYRLEQRGETLLCFRLRKFYMPDFHILTKDLREAVEVSKKVQEKILEEGRKAGFNYWAIYNVTEDFFNEHRDIVLDFVKREGKPVLVVVNPAGIYYWVINVEYTILDELMRPREIATFQIDIGNAERFNITYVDEKNEKKYPAIIHTAILGSIERYLYGILANAAKLEKQGKTPYIPTWLSPIQVRVIPMTKDHLEYALRVAEELRKHNIRVDVDDRWESLGKRIRDAAREWIPYIIVVGKREVETNTVNVRIRRTNDQKAMSLQEFLDHLERELEGYPRRPQTLPFRVSQRPPIPYLM